MMSLINKSADWPSNYHKAAITSSQIWWHPTSMNKLTLNDSVTTHDFILMGPRQYQNPNGQQNTLISPATRVLFPVFLSVF